MSRLFDFEQLVELCQRTHEETRRSAVRAIDRSLVVRNWLFGLLFRMAERFRHAGIRGASTTNLKRFRRSPTRPAEFVQRCWTNPDTRAPFPWWEVVGCEGGSDG